MFKPQVDSWFGPEPVSSAPSKLQVLPEDQLRTAITTKGSIAVVRVTEAVVRAEGAGNEQVSIAASVERILFGRAVISLEMTRSGRYPGVTRGQRYLVAVSGSGELVGYVPVAGDAERTFESHRRLVERLVLGR